jgi:hypothetical protein
MEKVILNVIVLCLSFELIFAGSTADNSDEFDFFEFIGGLFEFDSDEDLSFEDKNVTSECE